MKKHLEGHIGLNRLKPGLLGSAATLLATMALGAGITGASAQDADADFDMDLEEVTVTGSRIVRRDLTAPSPISTVGSEEFQLSGAQNVEQVLATLPQTIPGFGGSSNNPGDGTATVDLRGLGSRRTLVLVNGRRYLQSRQSGEVDLNTIPSTLIERVEVVTGGASAVYGSDAMSGVVNFVMRDDYEGLELSGQYDTTLHGDAERYNFSSTMGGNFADGRGNATLFVNYVKRKPLMQGDRKFSTYALGEGGDPDRLPGEAYGAGTGLGGSGSSGIPGTRLFDTVQVNPGTAGEYTLGRFNSDGSGAPYSAASDSFNYAPDNFLQLPQERWMASAMAHYQINDSVRMYTEATFVSNKVPQELAPTPAFATIEINPDSPFFTNDVQDAFRVARGDTNGDGVLDANDEGNLDVFIGRRMVENGPRQALDTRDAFRVLVGFDGEIGDGWSYDVSYSYARVDNFQFLKNDVSRSRFIQAIAVTDDGTACQDPSDGCVPLNIFGAGNITQEAIDFVNVSATNVTEIESQNLQAIVSGSLGDWTGAGEVGLAIGVEYRKDDSAFTPDTFLATGDVLGFNAGEATVGGFDTYEVFAEMALPLLTGAPMAENLEASLAARYSDYSTAGSVWSYAAGLTWAPVADISLRGQYQRAVRAPSVLELFQGRSNGFPGATDPCSDATENPSPTLIALCEATGVPAGQTGNFTQANAQIEGSFGGNPNLYEESSDTYTFGAVITPEALPGFTMAVDYYNIKIDDAIFVFGGGVNTILDLCYNEFQDLESPFCQAVSRRTDGNVARVDAGNANIGAIKAEGLDLQWSYGMDVDFGFFEGGSSLDFNFVGTHVINSETTPTQIRGIQSLVNDCEGTYGSTCGTPDPKYRFNLRTSLTNGPLQLSLNWRWLDSVEDDQIRNNGVDPASLPVASIKSESYFDLSFTYDVSENLQMYGGARNILNNKPTFLGDSQSQANTWPEAYDAIGTRVFMGARVRF
ncbi:TonB-dependent receptor plug domain-containing protein [Kordiimonas lacus]|uniref:TonB-dependent Receptor Plug Domain n=1 Tax=Kordiimonas lacus TaxID=637679 RepID=A0A1G6SVM3_9PROT|nr:TonB-dependent receptor [Kordiimonas lacus]SDD20828.1 TonB-dependent Receptor Plug Domain [Kordiimonas lacus]